MFITSGFEILALAITNLIRLVMGIVDNLHLMRPLTMPISCRYHFVFYYDYCFYLIIYLWS